MALTINVLEHAVMYNKVLTCVFAIKKSKYRKQYTKLSHPNNAYVTKRPVL